MSYDINNIRSHGGERAEYLDFHFVNWQGSPHANIHCEKVQVTLQICRIQATLTYYFTTIILKQTYSAFSYYVNWGGHKQYITFGPQKQQTDKICKPKGSIT